MSRNLSVEEEQIFWAELFAVMVRNEERIKVGGLEPRTRNAESF
jgi:hypothetical protein